MILNAKQKKLDKMVDIFFQPIFNVETLKIEKVEILVRRKKQKDNNSTGIIEYVKKNKLEIELDFVVINRVCNLIKSNKLNYPTNINLFNKTIQKKNSAKGIVDMLRYYKIPYSQIVFELNENTKFVNKNVEENVKYFNIYGIKISIDDFGIAAATLDIIALSDIIFHEVKLDRNFMFTIDKGRESWIADVIKMFKNENLDVVAEGIENHIQLGFLNAIGGLSVQGYFLCEPMSYRDFVEFRKKYEEENSA